MNAPDSPGTPPSKPEPARRSAVAVTRFLLVVLLVLGADLGLKHFSFEYVADRPVTLVRDWDTLHALFVAGEHDGRRIVVYDDPEGELAGQPAVVVVPSVLRLKLTTNTGAVFGLGAGNRWVFVAVSVLATAVIGYLFLWSAAGAWLQHTALALILAGALGNLYDRVRFGAVRDMLHMLPGVELPFGLSWPGVGGGVREVWPWVFNLADVSLLVGVGLMLVLAWRKPADAG